VININLQGFENLAGWETEKATHNITLNNKNKNTCCMVFETHAAGIKAKTKTHR